MEQDTVAAKTGDPRRAAFQRHGEYWTFVYAGVTCRLRDAVGLRYLAALLARPGERITASELIHTADPSIRRRPARRPSPDVTGPDVTGPVMRERARVWVTRAVRAAMARIATHHPPLGEHLAAAITTGTRCAYVPDPRIAPTWTLRAGGEPERRGVTS